MSAYGVLSENFRLLVCFRARPFFRPLAWNMCDASSKIIVSTLAAAALFDFSIEAQAERSSMPRYAQTSYKWGVSNNFLSAPEQGRN